MSKPSKYLYADGILKGGENVPVLILNEKEPSGVLSQDKKIKLDPLCDTLENVLSFLGENGYQIPSPQEVRDEIQKASQEGKDYITIEILPT